MIESVARQVQTSGKSFLCSIVAGIGLILSWPAWGFELAAGFALIEQGDDRGRPGLAVHGAFNEFYLGRGYYYGRDFGPIREDTYLLAFSRRFGLFKSNYISGHVGACAMNERITLRFRAEDSTDAGAGRNRSEDNYNVGGVFGITAALPKSASPLYAGISWDSHVFPAGLNGGLFLASGRKQAVSIYLGAAL